MNSADAEKYGISHWLSMNERHWADLWRELRCVYGVYVIRRRTPYSRKEGESDIVRIGLATGYDGLFARIRLMLLSSRQVAGDDRVTAKVRHSDDYEIGWAELETTRAASALKDALLERYLLEHWEPPPGNLGGPRKRESDEDALPGRAAEQPDPEEGELERREALFAYCTQCGRRCIRDGRYIEDYPLCFLGETIDGVASRLSCGCLVCDHEECQTDHACRPGP